MISTKQIALSQKGLKDYLKVQTWKQLRQWHRQNTPSVDDPTFKMFMMSYCGQAKRLFQEGKLLKQHIFMLKADQMQQQQREQLLKEQAQIQKKKQLEGKQIILQPTIDKNGFVIEKKQLEKQQKILKALDQIISDSQQTPNQNQAIQNQSSQSSELHQYTQQQYKKIMQQN